MRNKKLKVNIPNIIIYTCCFVWIFPQGLSIVFSPYNKYLNIAKCVLWGLMVVSVIRKGIHVSAFSKWLHFFWVSFLICILISDPSIVNFNTWLTLTCAVSGFALLFERYSYMSVVPRLYKYMYLLTVLNTVLYFIMPQGFEYVVSAYDGLSRFGKHSGLISTDNNMAPFIIAFLILGEVCYEKRIVPKSYYVGMWVLSWLTMLLCFSATGLIGLFVYSLITLITRTQLKRINIKLRHIALILIVAFLAVYYLQVQKLFSFLIIDVLGKDLSFTQRIGLWTKSIQMIKERPLFGYGNRNYGSIILRNNYYWYSHNLILDILLEGGIVTLGSFALLISSFARTVRKQKTDKLIRFIMFSLVSMAVINLTESYFSNVCFYLPFIVGVSLANTASNRKYKK